MTPSSHRERWLRHAHALVLATLTYNIIEAGIAVWFGLEAESIALFGFGLDSVIETAAGLAMLRVLRLRSRALDEAAADRAEHRVHRFIGATFIALAGYVALQAGVDLWESSAPETSTVGIFLAVLSLVVMPLVSLAKLRAARELESKALRAEAKETLACSYLSLTLLLGLLANALANWWWADPAAALLMVPWLIREGLEGLRGEMCCGATTDCS